MQSLALCPLTHSTSIHPQGVSCLKFMQIKRKKKKTFTIIPQPLLAGRLMLGEYQQLTLMSQCLMCIYPAGMKISTQREDKCFPVSL